MIQLLLNKTTPHFQLLPMAKIDKSSLRIHEVPPLQCPKSHKIRIDDESSFSKLTFIIKDAITKPKQAEYKYIVFRSRKSFDKVLSLYHK